MGKIHKAENGVFPKADTEIIFHAYKSNKSSGGIFFPGTHGYVTSHPADTLDGIVLSTNKGEYHGYYCTEWELAVEPNPIDALDDATLDALTGAALEAAKKLGYCDETKNVLKAMGLPTGPRQKVQLEFMIAEGDDYKVLVNGKPVKTEVVL